MLFRDGAEWRGGCARTCVKGQGEVLSGAAAVLVRFLQARLFGALFLGAAMVGGFLGRRRWGDESPVGANARCAFGGNMV